MSTRKVQPSVGQLKKLIDHQEVFCIPVTLVNVDSMDTKFGEYFLMFWRVIMLSSWHHDP